MARQCTADALKHIAEWEGNILYAYDDANGKKIMPGDPVRGTLTIGVGHTGPDVKAGMTISAAKSQALFDQDNNAAERVVEAAVKVPLNDNQFGTLVSFTFNVGAGAFLSSTLLKKLNKGDYASVPSELMKWTKTTIDGKKVTSPGLVARRSKEVAYWAAGANAAPTTQTAVAEATARPMTPMEVVTGAGTILGPAAGFATSTGWINVAFGVAIVAAVVIIGAIIIKRQFFAR